MPDGVGEGYAAMQQTPPMGPRAVFTGAESLAAVAEQARLANEKVGTTCAVCKVKQATIDTRNSAIDALKVEIDRLSDQLVAMSRLSEHLTEVTTHASDAERIRRLQENDVVQRRELDVQYFRADAAEARLTLHGIPIPELPVRFRAGTTLPTETS